MGEACGCGGGGVSRVCCTTTRIEGVRRGVCGVWCGMCHVKATGGDGGSSGDSDGGVGGR